MSQHYTLPLISKQVIADNTMAFTFSLKGTNYTFMPGQYAYFRLPDLPTEAENNKIFSFAHAPNGQTLTIIMRIRESAYKQAFAALQPGDSVQVSPALGFFDLHEDIARPAVFLAGGVGIAPFCSLIEQAINHKLEQPIYLFTSNQQFKDAIYLDKIADYQTVYPHLSTFVAFTQEEYDDAHYGRLTADFVMSRVPTSHSAIYYLSGSPNFVDSLSQQLQDAGIPLAHIKQESFTGYEVP